MEENECDENPSAFPLFNFAALKQSFTNVPVDITSTQDTLNPSNLLFKNTSETEDTIAKKKQPRTRISKKKAKESEESKVTLKDILEDLQTGIPMEADLKMKEEKLKKMKEGKAKKKLNKNKNKDKDAEESSKEDTEKSQTINTIRVESQKSLNLDPEFQDINTPFPSTRIIFKDGKPVLENIDYLQDLTSNNPLTLIQSSKPTKLSSMSFRKKGHTKQWTEEETRKFYKALELFGSDFSMITKLFPTRDRAQIKNKLHKEERENSKKVEDAFKQHEKSSRKLMSHLGDIPRKQIKGESETLPQLPTLDKINSMASDHRNRSFSNYSLDSVDAKIVDDLKDIFTKEIQQPKSKDLFGLKNEFHKGTPALEFGQEKSLKVNTQDLQLSDDSLKENNHDKIKFEKHKTNKEEKTTLETPNIQKNNLLLSLFSK